MKTMIRTGVVMVLLIAGTMAATAQNKGAIQPDSARMHREMGFHRGMQGNGPQMGQPGMNGMREGMGQFPGWGEGMDQGRQGMRGNWGQMPGMRGEGRPEMGQGFQGMMHQRMLFENIPNLTDKQKKDIAVLRIDQQTEMKKLQEDLQAKVKAMRDSHKAAIEKLLTPEQKKWLEENTPKPEVKSNASQTPVKTK